MSKAERKKLYGVGVNDAGYPVEIRATILGRREKIWSCQIYAAWKNMIRRCYDSKCQEKQPSYIGCMVTPEWHSFSAFRAWMTQQPWEGNQIDKDILFPGNKVYSPDTCIFVSHALNSFLTDRSASRGEWPIGVTWHKASGKFRASCRNPFTRKYEHLAFFTNPSLAHEAWRMRKHQHALTYAAWQQDKRIADALRGWFISHNQ